MLMHMRVRICIRVHLVSLAAGWVIPRYDHGWGTHSRGAGCETGSYERLLGQAPLVTLKTQKPLLPSLYQISCRLRSHAACDIANAPPEFGCSLGMAGRLK